MQLLQYLLLALAFFPAPVQIVILAIFAFVILFLVFKLIAFVLDCLPFI